MSKKPTINLPNSPTSNSTTLPAKDHPLVNLYQNDQKAISQNDHQNDLNTSEQTLVNLYQNQNPHKETDSNQYKKNNEHSALISFGKSLPKNSLINKNNNTEKPKVQSPFLPNITSPSTTPTTTSTTKPFKAFKAFSSSLTLNLKEKEKEKESLSFAGEPSRTDSTNDSCPINTTKSINTVVDEEKNNSHTMQRFAQQQETAEGIIYNRSDAVILPDPNCKYCLGKARLFNLTGENKTKETPCICCKLYLLEPLVNEQKKILVGTPKLSPSELALQKEIVSKLDECEIVDQSKVISVPKQANSISNTQPNKQSNEKKEVTDKSTAPKENKVKATENAKVNPKETYDKYHQLSSNSALDRKLVRKEEFPYIEELNQTAHLRLNNKGEADLEIPSSKCGKYWILPNRYNQQRNSTVSFWDWLLFALREPNRYQPVRLACSRYYLGDKDQEIQSWLKERANLGVGSSSNCLIQTRDDNLPAISEIVDIVNISDETDPSHDLQNNANKEITDVITAHNFPLRTDYQQPNY